MSDLENSEQPVLSERGRGLVAAPSTPEYVREHFARSTSPYDSATRPNGYIAMCIAENGLVWDILQPKMAACRDISARVLSYDSMIGSLDFRTQLARFMGRAFLGRAVSPEHVAVLAGAGSVLEILFYVLADRGEGVLVPTPSYAGFWQDLQTRDELTIVPVHCTSADGFRLTPSHLDRAVESAGRRIRALLFTSPNNPLGTVYSRSEIESILRWAEGLGIHVVFDEIYALSVFGQRTFISCASLRPSLGERVHIVWAFSKDFGASGLRCGALVSENEAVIAAVDALAYWACCSGDTQFLLGQMVADDAWVDAYVAAMRARLGDAYRAVTGALEQEQIPYLPAEAGFFFLCDLRRFMAEPTWEAEHALWRRMLEEANVNLTPGWACRVAEPGFMRLCFANLPPETAAVAVHRLGALFRSSRHS
jgi:aspartate/methionine/tyrosine aminotransferase